MDKKGSEYSKGVAVLIAGQLVFSVLIFYWKIIHAPPLEILCNRTLWSVVITFFAVVVFDKKKAYKEVLRDKKRLVTLLLAGLLLAVNWGTYLYAVASGNILEAAMGYFINPLFLSLAGLFLFKEEKTTYNIVAILFGAAGIIYMTVQYGRPPYYAIIVSISYALYSLTKRKVPVRPDIGMFFENIALLPLSLTYFIYLIFAGQSSFLQPFTATPYLLVTTGAATLIPLMMYAYGIQKTSMLMVGFTCYIYPTLAILIGVFFYNEQFTATHAVAFSLIWIGVIVFTYGRVKEYRKAKKREAENTAN